MSPPHLVLFRPAFRLERICPAPPCRQPNAAIDCQPSSYCPVPSTFLKAIFPVGCGPQQLVGPSVSLLAVVSHRFLTSKKNTPLLLLGPPVIGRPIRARREYLYFTPTTLAQSSPSCVRMHVTPRPSQTRHLLLSVATDPSFLPPSRLACPLSDDPKRTRPCRHGRLDLRATRNYMDCLTSCMAPIPSHPVPREQQPQIADSYPRPLLPRPALCTVWRLLLCSTLCQPYSEPARSLEFVTTLVRPICLAFPSPHVKLSCHGHASRGPLSSPCHFSSLAPIRTRPPPHPYSSLAFMCPSNAATCL